MSIDIGALLSRGRPEEKMLEKIADGVLALPRTMWQGKRVTFFNAQQKQMTVSDVSNLTKTMCWPHSSTPKRIGKTVVYGILSVVAAPILLLGLTLKCIALAADPKAHAYSLIMQNTLDVDALNKKYQNLAKQRTALEETFLKTYNNKKAYDNIKKHIKIVLDHRYKKETDGGKTTSSGDLEARLEPYSAEYLYGMLGYENQNRPGITDELLLAKQIFIVTDEQAEVARDLSTLSGQDTQTKIANAWTTAYPNIS